MAISLAELKEQLILTLYDYMLTSDDEAYWFSVAAIREALDPDVSGALVKIALKGLHEDDGSVDAGFDDQTKIATFSLTEDGILAAEEIITSRGIPLREYSPAPSADLILSRLDDQTRVQAIQGAIAEIGKELRENNEIGAALGEDKDIITSEIAAAEVVVAKGSFRLQRLIALVVPALRFIVDRFSGSAISETAKRLIALLFQG